MPRPILALPLLVGLLAAASFAGHSFFGLRASPLLPTARWLLWSIEACGLIGLYWVARGTRESDRRPADPTLDGARLVSSYGLGISVGLAAWVFRGPVVSTTLLAAGAWGRSEARAASIVTLVVYLLCGLVLGWVGRSARASAAPAP